MYKMMEEQTLKRLKTYLKDLKNRNTCSSTDEQLMSILLDTIGFKNAKIVSGICYLSGYGKPIDIHTVAKNMYEGIKDCDSETDIFTIENKVKGRIDKDE